MTEASSSSPHPLSMLEKRRIEAEILKEVYLTLKESHGEEMAKKTIAESVRRSAVEQAQAFAAAARRSLAQGVPGRDAAVDQGRGARDRGQGAER